MHATAPLSAHADAHLSPLPFRCSSTPLRPIRTRTYTARQVADVQHLVGHLAKLPRLQRLGLVVILARLVEIGDGEPVKRLFESAALVCWSELAGVRAGVSVVSPFCLGRP
jgi:hypothetical protein